MMDERFIRVSAYGGKNCCPLKIRGLDLEKDMEEAMAAVERLFERPWKLEISEFVEMDGIMIITDAKARMEKDFYGN